MITKAIVKYKKGNKYGVHIPYFQCAGDTKEFILEATLCAVPGQLEAYKPDDIVFIDFENNELQSPIILGKLYLGQEEELSSSFSSGSIKISGNASFPKNTTIGGIDFLTIYDTFKMNEAMQKAILKLQEEIEELKEQVNGSN